METDLLLYVLAGLEAARGKWREVSTASSVPYDTITKIAQGQIADPGVSKVQRLADYFRGQGFEMPQIPKKPRAKAAA